jgi:hypothetical protein
VCYHVRLSQISAPCMAWKWNAHAKIIFATLLSIRGVNSRYNNTVINIQWNSVDTKSAYLKHLSIIYKVVNDNDKQNVNDFIQPCFNLNLKWIHATEKLAYTGSLYFVLTEFRCTCSLYCKFFLINFDIFV